MRSDVGAPQSIEFLRRALGLGRRNMLRAIGLASALFLVLLSPTIAEAAFTDGHFVHIRSGPGMKHPVVHVAWPGVQFTVHDCGRYWCSVSYLWFNGWMSASHIVGK